MILVLGATGNVGKHTVKKLHKLGHNIVIGTRDIDKARKSFSYLDNLEYRLFDFLKKETYAYTLKEVKSVFFVRPPRLANPSDIYPFIDKLVAKGISHVVFMSLMGVEKNPIPPHGKIEKYISNTSLNYTFLRPGFFMENLIYPHGSDIKKYNKIILPAGSSQTAFIAAKDIGECAAICLHEGETHHNKAYTLTGDKAYTYFEVANIMSSVLNKNILYTNPGFFRYRKHMISEGFDRPYTKITILLYLMTRLGTAKSIHNGVNLLLKRKPTDLKTFIEENKSVWL